MGYTDVPGETTDFGGIADFSRGAPAPDSYVIIPPANSATNPAASRDNVEPRHTLAHVGIRANYRSATTNDDDLAE